MSEPVYKVQFNLYYAAEGSFSTGHSNVTVTKYENGAKTFDKTFGVNVQGGNLSTAMNPYSNTLDGTVGVDLPGWRPDNPSVDVVTKELTISESEYQAILDTMQPYTGTDFSGYAPVNYDVFASVNPLSPDGSMSCYSFAQSIYELIGGTGSSFVDEFSTAQLNQLTDNFIETFYGDLDPGRIMEDMMDYANDLADDYGWAWEHPGEVLREALPPWVPASWIPFLTSPQQDSPLVLDLDGDGIELVALNINDPGAFFDLDNDGFAEATGWVSADDGLLARDVNQNGRIDDASELFGSASTDGFAILSLLDSNGDLVINQNDTAFAELLIWQDANEDGVSQAEELNNLAHYGIVSIDLSGIALSTSVIAGNQISHTSTFTYENGSHGTVVDAWFAVNNTLSTYSQSYTFDLRAAFLPTLRGFGELADLHIAMSLDNQAGGLLELVEDFAGDFTFAAFANQATLRGEIEDILFRWADVTAAGQNFTEGPYSGQAAYAEEVQFLEKLFGVMSESTRYNPDGTGGRVPGGSGRALAESFEIAYQNLSAQLLIQVGTGVLFDQPPVYDAFTGEIDGDLTLSEAGIDSLIAFATASGVDAEAYWLAVAKFLDTVKGFENFSSTENGWMDAAIYDSDPGLTWSGIKDLAAFEYQPSTIYGTNDDDVIDGTAGDNIIHGYTGNDVIDGKAGNDTLIGNTSGPVTSEDDATYIGGAGDDFVNGGQGDDIYIYTSGDDFYEDIQGTDVIKLPSGIALGDLHFAVSDTYNLIITVGDLGSIEIKDQFQNNPYFIETIEFYDTSTLSLSTINSITQYGTGGNDTITGITYGGGDDDIIYGMDGNDTIYGGTGDDVIDGGAGNDTITPGDGNDTIIASEGFDTILASDASETLVIPEAFSASDVILLREADGSGNDKELKIIVNGLGQIHVDDHFQGTNKALDQISFANGVDASINLLTYSFITIGTNGDDTFDTSGYGLSNTSDIYLFGKGTDTVLEYAGTDTVLFAAGLGLSNISVIKKDTGTSSSTRNFLVISDADGNSLTVERHFDGGGYKIENLKLNNGTVISVASLEIDSHGSEGNDRIDGLESGDLTTDDVMYGHDGDDQLYGGSGDDILYGGEGTDDLYGDSGGDTFVFETASAFSDVDNVYDFDISEDDVIDIADLLTAYDPLTEIITDFVQITDNGTHSYLAVDVDGGANNFVQIATLYGVTGLTDEDALESGGYLKVA